jgi:pimeloyl-ACP methyl ester carboxylesterase
VLVSPFLDFCRGSSREKVLKMISGMDKDPETTMRWFWKLCGIRNPPQRVIHEHQKLKLCLNFLCQSRVNPEQIKSELPVILIHGLKDRIVPIKASEILLEYLPYACFHSLPFGHFIPEEEIIKAVYGQSD